MILGFCHISYSVCDINEALEIFTAQGYNTVFYADGIENNISKKKLLQRYELQHTIVLMNAKSALPVELTQHSKVYAEGKGNLSLDSNHIELRTTNKNAETKFFTDVLRFKDQKNLVVNSSPVPGWSVRIKIVEDKSTETHFLDSRGHTCIAFYTNDLEQDLSKCLYNNVDDVTDIFILRPVSKMLKIAMFRTPGGTILELIEVIK